MHFINKTLSYYIILFDVGSNWLSENINYRMLPSRFMGSRTLQFDSDISHNATNASVWQTTLLSSFA